MIAANQQDVQLFFRHHGDQLDGFLQRNTQQSCDIFAGGLFRRVDVVHRFRCGRTGGSGGEGFGHFDVGGVVGIRAESDAVFAAVGQDMEFMRS